MLTIQEGPPEERKSNLPRGFTNDNIFWLIAQSDEAHLYIGYINEHFPDPKQRNEIIGSLARNFVTYPVCYKTDMAMVFAHYVVHKEQITPQQLHDQLYKKLSVFDTNEFSQAVKNHLIPSLKVLFPPDTTKGREDKDVIPKISSHRSLMGNVLERICDKERDREDEDDDSIYPDIDEGTTEAILDNDWTFLKPKPSVDYLTIGRIYDEWHTNLKTKFPKDTIKIQKSRNDMAKFYYLQALENIQHPYTLLQYKIILDAGVQRSQRGLVEKALGRILTHMQGAQGMFEDKKYISMYTEVSDDIIKAIRQWENSREGEKDANDIYFIKKQWIDLYSHFPAEQDILKFIQKISQDIGERTGSYLSMMTGKISPELPLPESQITNVQQHILFIDSLQKNGFLQETKIFSAYLDLAICLAKQGNIQEARQAYSKGKERFFKPGFGTYYDESLHIRDNAFVHYIFYQLALQDIGYERLATAIQHYLSQQKQDGEKDEAYYQASLTLGLRYEQHHNPICQSFFTEASYCANEKICGEALEHINQCILSEEVTDKDDDE